MKNSFPFQNDFFSGDLGKAPDAVTDTLPVPEIAEEEGATGGAEVSDMQARLEALRS